MSRSLSVTVEEYDAGAAHAVHRRRGLRGFTTSGLAAVAIAAWIAAHVGGTNPWFAPLRWPSVVLATWCAVAGRRWAVVCAVVGAGLAGGSGAWHAVDVPATGECSGRALVRTDPETRGPRTTVVVEIEGLRWRAIAHGSLAGRLSRVSAGETLEVTAVCTPGVGRFARIDRVRHVVGTAALSSVSETSWPASKVALASNRLRRALVEGAEEMSGSNRALFTGLVIGDDRAQTAETVAEFRAAGLSHLTAVSGQNIAYLLVVATPVLALLGRWSRLAAVVALVGWFVVLTRAEPSVVRAAAMAAVAAVAVASSRPANGRAVLAIAVLVLLAVDPMLAWSIGFALSVSATAGLAWLSAPLSKMLGSGRAAKVIVPTLAAQLGTAPVSLWVFGSVPVVGLVANPLVLPVAGVVMTFGIPAALAAAILDRLAPVVALVLEPALWWITTVAHHGDRLGPTGRANACVWCAVVGTAWWRSRRVRVRTRSFSG